ncbi:MAG: pyridoxamine 5'-phosphate oxidase family protein, partial [Coriobacteriales bacterium]|nr:pyridoxamine 5'-phosphate oxidase family protein [Coriobacteriales bacterium]
DACDKASFCVLDEGRKEEGSWWYHFNSVIAFGRITRVEDEEELLSKLRLLGGKYFPPEVDMEADIARNLRRVVVLELTIEHLSGKRVREK